MKATPIRREYQILPNTVSPPVSSIRTRIRYVRKGMGSSEGHVRPIETHLVTLASVVRLHPGIPIIPGARMGTRETEFNRHETGLPVSRLVSGTLVNTGDSIRAHNDTRRHVRWEHAMAAFDILAAAGLSQAFLQREGTHLDPVCVMLLCEMKGASRRREFTMSVAHASRGLSRVS